MKVYLKIKLINLHCIWDISFPKVFKNQLESPKSPAVTFNDPCNIYFMRKLKNVSITTQLVNEHTFPGLEKKDFMLDRLKVY